MSNRNDPVSEMRPPDDHELIDRHLAGVLTAAEEARLEDLIRTSPAWRERYRDAERMASLLRAGLGGPGAPPSRRAAIRARIEAEGSTERPRSFLRAGRRPWLVAAAVLVALVGAYLFVDAGSDGPFIQPVYADAPMPLADLARASDVLLLGTVVREDGRLGLRLERTLYGDAAARSLALPAGLSKGQRVALFGRYVDDDSIRVVADRRGIVHLDGVQQWEGKRYQPERVRERIERSGDLRTLEGAVGDLKLFLASSSSRHAVRREDDLRFSAEITARFLGRFDVERVRPILMELIRAQEKHPEVRNAGAESLVDADPLESCRMLLKAILGQELEHLHAETENGYVVLRCLQLMQRRGHADLAENLAALLDRVHCPVLMRAAQAALLAVRGEGTRTPGADIAPLPMRLTQDGREATVIPGCGGKAEGLLVIFRAQGGVAQLATLIGEAIHAQRCVLVLPEGDGDAAGWLQLARSRAADRISAGPVQYLGIGLGKARAVQAAASHAPSRLILVGTQPVSGLAALESAGVPIEKVASTTLGEVLRDRALWKRVLAAE